MSRISEAAAATDTMGTVHRFIGGGGGSEEVSEGGTEGAGKDRFVIDGVAFDGTDGSDGRRGAAGGATDCGDWMPPGMVAVAAA
jgi:hypothetical protein